MTQRNISVTQIATIAKQISLLVEPGQVVELRVMGVDGRNNRTDSGYFDNVDDLAAAAAEYSGRAASVYMTINPVQPALLARAYNRVEQYSKTTTNDKDIVTRRWFMIDFDPIRPSDISSTDEEHGAAIARAGECALWLADRGWPQPILADSGNGAHLLYRIDMPTMQANELLSKTLQAIAMTFDDLKVSVDIGNFNPARIWKVYGTLAAKGDNLPQRPHREAAILSAPSELQVVAPSLFNDLMALLPEPDPVDNRRNGEKFDLAQWIAKHSLDVNEPRAWNGGTRWVFKACPWNSDHTDKSAYIVQFNNGAIAAGCHHNSCQGNNWQMLREKYDGPRQAPTQRRQAPYTPTIYTNGANGKIPHSTAGVVKPINLLSYRPEDGGVLDAWCDLYADSWLFATGKERWLYWSGTHWQRDEALAIKRQIEQLLDEMNQAAQGALLAAQGELTDLHEDDPAYATLESEINYYRAMINATKRNGSRVNSIETMAQARRAVSANALDAGNFLNLSNGTLDLISLELHPHTYTDYLTYVLPYAYDANAKCPRWEKFLTEVLVQTDDNDQLVFGPDGKPLADLEMIHLYQQLWGYSLTTDTKQEIMVWQSGEGGNGKSVAITVLQHLLGDLAVSVNFKTLGESGNYDLSKLPGRRVIFSTESKKNGRLAEDIIRMIVSGEAIPTREPYGKPYDFRPVGKIFWNMNDKPRITDTSNAIWRRLQLIPFNRTFPKHEQDTRLTFKLLEELPGILNWALWGLVDLRQTNRFMTVQAVELAKQAYRRESNPVQQWAEERTNVTDMPLTKAGVLFDDFIQWLDDNGHPKHMFNSTQFGLELKRLKYLCKRIPQGVRYFLALKPYQQEM